MFRYSTYKGLVLAVFVIAYTRYGLTQGVYYQRQGYERRISGKPDCYKFTRMFNAITPDGDLTVTVGNNMSPEECTQACLGMFGQSRVCMAATQRHGGCCILAGYKMYPTKGTTHFRRLCRKGRDCFEVSEGMETRFHTGVIMLPTMGGGSEFLAADLCRKECEEMVYCTGFDVIHGRNYCPYTEFRPIKNLYFNTYLRTC